MPGTGTCRYRHYASELLGLLWEQPPSRSAMVRLQPCHGSAAHVNTIRNHPHRLLNQLLCLKLCVFPLTTQMNPF